MKKYNTIYPFRAIDEIKAGNTVYFLDRKLHDCGIVNNISVEDLGVMLKSCDGEPDRFEFWTEEEQEIEE